MCCYVHTSPLANIEARKERSSPSVDHHSHHSPYPIPISEIPISAGQIKRNQDFPSSYDHDSHDSQYSSQISEILISAG